MTPQSELLERDPDPNGIGGLSAADQLRVLADPAVGRGIRVVAALGIPDTLRDGPLSVSRIATKARVDEDALFRLLRLLAAARVFRNAGDNRFELTPLGALLRSDAPGSVASELTLLEGDEPGWIAVGELMETLRTGRSASDRRDDGGFWAALERNPAALARFVPAMAARSADLARALGRSIAWSDRTTVADVGGGAGGVIATLLELHPHLSGYVVERPAVAPYAERLLRERGLTGRCEVVVADFFDALPTADCYLLANVVHDWPDAQARALLENCRRSGHSESTTVVVEMVVEDEGRPSAVLTLDILLLCLLGGRERTVQEFEQLFSNAGFSSLEVVPVVKAFAAFIGTTTEGRV
jgi:hypothetical protein